MVYNYKQFMCEEKLKHDKIYTNKLGRVLQHKLFYKVVRTLNTRVGKNYKLKTVLHGNWYGFIESEDTWKLFAFQ